MKTHGLSSLHIFPGIDGKMSYFGVKTRCTTAACLDLLRLMPSERVR
ncbi:hypothetical protein HMPREF0972_01193 [Actinomyces sp. oral taxon 848 str. F0332]|nr:hypothetical protein HMPREF0972_01193 [Actinomyces sp. oral taxon 848 str. F0332]